jgi:hypothetical protein
MAHEVDKESSSARAASSSAIVIILTRSGQPRPRQSWSSRTALRGRGGLLSCCVRGCGLATWRISWTRLTTRMIQAHSLPFRERHRGHGQRIQPKAYNLSSSHTGRKRSPENVNVRGRSGSRGHCRRCGPAGHVDRGRSASGRPTGRVAQWGTSNHLYLLALVVVVVGVDVLFFKHHYWARLIGNIEIVLVFGVFYLRLQAALVGKQATASGSAGATAVPSRESASGTLTETAMSITSAV